MQPDSFRSSVKSMAVPLIFCLLASSVDVRFKNDFNITGWYLVLDILQNLNFMASFAKKGNLFCYSNA